MNIFAYSYKGDCAAVKQLLEEDPGLVNIQQKFTVAEKPVTYTPLFLAALGGQADVVGTLVDRGAALTVEGMGDVFAWSCMCPDVKARVKVIETLAKKKVFEKIPDLDERYLNIARGEFQKPFEGKYGLPSAQVSALCENYRTLPHPSTLSDADMKELIEWATDKEKLFAGLKNLGLDGENHSSLHLAALFGKLDMIQDAFERKDLNPDDEIGRTLAVLAAAGGHVPILVCLKGQGVDLSKPSQTEQYYGLTPFMGAAMGYVSVEKYLDKKKNMGQVLEFFGIDESLHDSVEGLNYYGTFKWMHVACLALDIEMAQAMLKVGYSISESHKGQPFPPKRDLALPIDYVLRPKGERTGPLSERENKQIAMLEFCMENGYDRNMVLEAVLEKRTRLYEGLLSEAETLLEQILSQKQLMKGILTGKAECSKGQGVFHWNQHDKITEIELIQFRDQLRKSLETLRAKNENEPALFPPIALDIQKLLDDDQPSAEQDPSSRTLSTEECRQLGECLERIEQASAFLSNEDAGDCPNVSWFSADLD